MKINSNKYFNSLTCTRLYKKQRSIKGYADIDCLNMSNWFLNIIPDMLEDLAANTTTYPNAYNDINTWKKDLLDCANKIKQVYFLLNEYFDRNETAKTRLLRINGAHDILDNALTWFNKYIV